MLRILFVADGRSPIAVNWIGYFIAEGWEVHLASSYPCEPLPGLASFHVVPVAFSSAAGLPQAGSARRRRGAAIKRLTSPAMRTTLRQWLGPFTLGTAAHRLCELITSLQPDLIHAMRIPYEGMMTALALAKSQTAFPFLVSVWGNDFTLHAKANPVMAHYTRFTLRNASALHTDCQRDQRLAHAWDFPSGKPAIVLPGAGGVKTDIFYPLPQNAQTTPLIINPRGMRAYVRNDAFFKAIPLVLQSLPEASFVCPAMQGDAAALAMVEEAGIGRHVELLPLQTRPQMAQLFQRAQIAVSPSFHDGTPNTLLEAMACGCFPIAGDIESVREWITSGRNGLLVDPGDAQALANAMLQACREPELRASAAVQNAALIAERAEHRSVMKRAEEFYHFMTPLR